MTLGRLGTAVVVVLLASGCSLPGSGPDAGKAADRVAAGFSAGKLTGTAFASADQKSYDTLTAGLTAGGTVHPTVSASRVSTHGDTATARLSWSWPVRSATWRYTTDARLRRSGDHWQLQWQPDVVAPRLSAGQTLQLTTLKAQRGDILGAGGVKLVSPRPVLRVGIDRGKVAAGQAGASARRLAALVGVTPAPYAKRVSRAGAKAFVEAIILRRSDVPDSRLSQITAIPGAVALSDHLPLAPSKDFGSGLLGTVGPATAEIVKASKGRVRAGDDTGISGLQKRYDEQLAGSPGVKVVAVDSHGTRSTLFQTDPVAGKPLSLTLDRRLQDVAQQSLAHVGPASALVAIRPSTGAILAAASGPGSHGYDTATYGRYAPGSTFKIVTSLALLRAGLTPTSVRHCTDTVNVGGRSFKNYSDYPPSRVGDISLTDALANSCNTAFLSSHGLVHGDALGQAAAALGFGVDHDTGFPAYFGQVPPPGSEVEKAADMIGQGRVAASPMAMAGVVASVLAGKAVIPTLVPSYAVKASAPQHPLTSREAQQLRTMMRAVVTRGTGVLLAGLPGQVIAKTGTAEFGTPGPGGSLPTHAWMVAGRGDLAVAVFVDRGKTGAETAGPVLEQFLRAAH